MANTEKALRGSFVPSHALKLALIRTDEGKAKVGDIVTVAYQRGPEKETVSGQYPIRYIVEAREGVTLAVLGEKVRTLQSFCW